MNFDEIKQQLNEVRMAQSNLNQFLNSPRAAGIRSGFEAELIFSEMGEANYDDAEYVDDFSYDRSARSIDSIVDFFAENTDSNSLSRLRERLWEDFLDWRNDRSVEDFSERESLLVRDWLEENTWNWDEKLREYLTDELELSDEEVQAIIDAGKEYAYKITSSKQQRELREKDKNYDAYLKASNVIDDRLDELVEEEVSERGRAWEAAFEAFQEDSEYSDETWLREADLYSMGEIYQQYDHLVNWPYQTIDDDSIEGGYTYDNARTLADSLEQDLGVTAEVSRNYHGQTKDGTSWYFEPDGSLAPDSEDDMPVEIVSPPMSLKDTHQILPQFFNWVDSNNGYANQSTGFHMSLSMPDHDESTVDYLKLALFLGDEYVLKSFSREANRYCESSLDIIKKRLANNPSNATEILPKAFEKMRKNMIELASRSISTHGQGKFVTIHDRSNYIEFRSAGNNNYFTDINRVQNTLLRYAYAMSIASDPAAERQEYAKKLYKFLSGAVQTNTDSMQYFVKYAAGELPRSALVSFVKKARLDREKSKQEPAPAPAANQDTDSQDWEVINTMNGNARVQRFRAINRQHANNQALELARRLSSNPDLVRLPSWWTLRQI